MYSYAYHNNYYYNRYRNKNIAPSRYERISTPGEGGEGDVAKSLDFESASVLLSSSDILHGRAGPRKNESVSKRRIGS